MACNFYFFVIFRLNLDCYEKKYFCVYSPFNNKISSGNKVNQPESNTKYYKLPFIGRFSGQTQVKLDALIKKL